MNKENYRNRVIFHIFAAALFLASFTAGSFIDETAAAALYSAGSVPAVIGSTVGIYPFTAAAVFLYGVIFERCIDSSFGKAKKTAGCLGAVLAGISSGIIGAYVAFGPDCLGVLLPKLRGNYLAVAIVAAVFIYPIFFFGCAAAKRNSDSLLLKRALLLLTTMAAAMLLMLAVKSLFSRPRYRLVVSGTTDIGFMPWYTPFTGASELIASLGIEKNEFRSFPSGHSVFSVSCIFILPCLADIFPGLKGRENLLSAAGLIFGVAVMLSRTVLGAHYLSDVSAGALIAVAASFIHLFVSRRMLDRQQI